MPGLDWKIRPRNKALKMFLIPLPVGVSKVKNYYVTCK